MRDEAIEIRGDAMEKLGDLLAEKDDEIARLRATLMEIRGVVGEATPGLLGSTVDGVRDLVCARDEARSALAEAERRRDLNNLERQEAQWAYVEAARQRNAFFRSLRDISRVLDDGAEHLSSAEKRVAACEMARAAAEAALRQRERQQ